MARARDPGPVPRPDVTWQGAISLALLAGIAFVPIVVAAGFLIDGREPALPSDISVAALRGAIDHGTAERPPAAHAGF